MIRVFVTGLVFVTIIYAAVVAASGSGWNPLQIGWNFENSGQFGDSFGPLTSVFSAIAAVSAYLAYQSQKNQLVEAKKSAHDDRISNERRDFENTFFKMLDFLRSVVRDTDVEHRDKSRRGVDAFNKILTEHYYLIHEKTDTEIEKAYKSVYKSYKNDLGHYFRLCYHILKYIDESSVKDKMFYVRIYRANFSNSEIVLLGLNAAYGSGFEKFRPLIEKYAILHNISAEDARKFLLLQKFEGTAFGDRSISTDPLDN